MAGSAETLGDTRTMAGAAMSEQPDAPRALICLTILAHADGARVGERASFSDLADSGPIVVSRREPNFRHPGGKRVAPLADPFVSRKPLVELRSEDGQLRLVRRHERVRLRVDGEALMDAATIDEASLQTGVVLEIAGRCALLLHQVRPEPETPPPRFGMVGDSDAIVALRRDIERVAQTDLRVLIRGESGSGKELVAGAIVAASRRAEEPYVCVNMGALTPDLAASALFGHKKGAFSGAVDDRVGHFVAASGGSLFLDEIAETASEVQAMLLRTLESGEVQPLGDDRTRRVDVRLLTATDADLESAVAAGRFREPLLHRISELTLAVPPLRARRDDIGRLLVHLMREQLVAMGRERLLDRVADRDLWLTPAVVATLVRASWPGNVRQLRNVARQLVVMCSGEERVTLTDSLRAAIGFSTTAAEPESTSVAPAPAKPQPPAARDTDDISDHEVVAALEQCGWRRAAAAELLGVSRSWLYAQVAKNDAITKANDLTREQVTEALEACDRDVAASAKFLRVSRHGLKLRMKALGLQR